MFKLTKYSRKVIIYGISCACLVGCSFFVDSQNYSILAEKIVQLSFGFFAGNSLEHIAGVFKK